MTTHTNDNLLDSDEEPMRLERQVQLDGPEREVTRLTLKSETAVLDAGCGSGALSRAVARPLPRGHFSRAAVLYSPGQSSQGGRLRPCHPLLVLAARSAAMVFSESCSSVSTCLATTR